MLCILPPHETRLLTITIALALAVAPRMRTPCGNATRIAHASHLLTIHRWNRTPFHAWDRLKTLFLICCHLFVARNLFWELHDQTQENQRTFYGTPDRSSNRGSESTYAYAFFANKYKTLCDEDPMQWETHGHLELNRWKIFATDHFGCGMLNLQTWVSPRNRTCSPHASRGIPPYRQRRWRYWR